MADNTVEVLNNWPELMLKAKRRTRSGGKERVTIEVKSEALGVVTDEAIYAKAIADAFILDLQAAIRGISTWATETTNRKRQQAKDALERGVAYAVERYSGGKLGKMPPAQTKRDLLDSGRLVKGLVATPRRDGSTVTVNVPDNRLNRADVYANTMQKLQPMIAQAMTTGKNLAEAGKKIAKSVIKKRPLSARDARPEIGASSRELARLLGQSDGEK